MDKHLELIWKKIDGSLSQSETKDFQHLLQNDANFTMLYKSQKQLNSSLKKIPSIEAPTTLLTNVLLNISEKKSYLKEYSSFGGIKVIAMACAGIFALSVLIVLSSNISSDLTAYPLLSQWMNKLSFSIPSEGFENYSKFMLVLIPGIVLIWLDKMFRSAPLQVKTINR